MKVYILALFFVLLSYSSRIEVEALDDKFQDFSEDMCSMEPGVVGHCKGNFPMWTYNKEIETQCEEFTYGGCGGNKNRFETLEICNNFRVFCWSKTLKLDVKITPKEKNTEL